VCMCVYVFVCVCVCVNKEMDVAQLAQQVQNLLAREHEFVVGEAILRAENVPQDHHRHPQEHPGHSHAERGGFIPISGSQRQDHHSNPNSQEHHEEDDVYGSWMALKTALLERSARVRQLEERLQVFLMCS
jgi:hypothetical protein